jgi:sirohydrochlorin ferrochelatase
MSSIPSSAMPHANADALEREESEGTGADTPTLTERATKLASSAADLARDNPKTAIAAGAALFAGAVAAAAIPAVRARKSSGGKSSSGGSSGGGSKKKKG